MKTVQILKPCMSFVSISAILLGVGLFTLMAPGSAQADSIAYNFSGTLANAFNGNNTVTGEFTLDTTNATVTAFDFTTPVGDINSSTNWTPHVATFTPALNPPTDFVQLFFETQLHADFMNLVFETPLSTFSGSTFYTGAVTPSPAALLESVIQCTGLCSDPQYHSTFVSGVATPVSTPEPSSLLLLGTGLLGLAPLLLRRFRYRHD